jgi:hypothetical protein
VGLHKEQWVDELSKVVWAHNTTVSRSTNFTPFKLLYGEEAMTPEEIKFQGPRTNVQIIKRRRASNKQGFAQRRKNKNNP